MLSMRKFACVIVGLISALFWSGRAEAACSPDGTGCLGVWLGSYGPGAVLVNPKFVIVYWGWNGEDTSNNKPYLRQTVASLGGTKYWNTLTQYYQYLPNSNAFQHITNSPNLLLAEVVDNNYPGAPLTVAQEQAYVDSLHGSFPSPDRVIILALPPYATYVDSNGVWHSGGPSTGSNCASHFEARTAPFIELPYQGPGSGCGITVGAAVSSNAMHEMAETATNPHPATFPGWAGDINEIGDPCTADFINMGTIWRTTEPTIGISNLVGQALWSQQEAGAHLAPPAGCVGSLATNWVGGSNLSGAISYWNGAMPFTGWHTTNAGGFPGTAVQSYAGRPPSNADTVSDVGVSAWPHGGANFWVVDSNRHLQQTWGSGWSDWGLAPLGYQWIGTPSVASWAEGRVDIFAFASGGGDVHLFHLVWDAGAQYGWHDLGHAPCLGQFCIPTYWAGSPAAVGSDFGRIDVFVMSGSGDGTGDTLYRLVCNTFADCNNGTFVTHRVGALSPAWASNLTASSWQPNRFDMFSGAATDGGWGIVGVSHIYADNIHELGSDTWWAPGSAPAYAASAGFGDGRLLVAVPQAYNTGLGNVDTYLWSFGTTSWTNLPVSANVPDFGMASW